MRFIAEVLHGSCQQLDSVTRSYFVGCVDSARVQDGFSVAKQACGAARLLDRGGA
jgi:hypothetical protein